MLHSCRIVVKPRQISSKSLRLRSASPRSQLTVQGGHANTFGAVCQFFYDRDVNFMHGICRGTANPGVGEQLCVQPTCCRAEQDPYLTKYRLPWLSQVKHIFSRCKLQFDRPVPSSRLPKHKMQTRQRGKPRIVPANIHMCYILVYTLYGYMKDDWLAAT